MRYQSGMITTHHWWVDLGQKNRIDRSNKSTVHNVMHQPNTEAQVPLGTLAKLRLTAFVGRGNGFNRSKAVLRESNDEAIEQCDGKGWDESYATRHACT